MAINVTQPGDVARWDRLHEQWTARGASVSRSQSPALAHPSRYRSPLSNEPEDHGEVVAWLRLAMAVSGRRISTVTALFKEAVLSQHQRVHGTPRQYSTGTGSATRATRPPVTWRSRTLASHGRAGASTAWPCGCPGAVTDGAPDGPRCGAFSTAAQGPRGRRGGCSARGRGTSHGRPSGSLATVVARLGDGDSSDPRAATPSRPGGSRTLVPARGVAGPCRLPISAHPAGPRGARPRPRRGEPTGQAAAALLTC